MDKYIDELAPWEKRNAYYKDVKLGKEVGELKKILVSQAQEMITTQIASTDGIISSRKRSEDAIHYIGYDMKNVGQGMRGLQAAFEWGISDVVWLVEKNTEEFRTVMINICPFSDEQMYRARYQADNAYAKGNIQEALEKFLEFKSFSQNDFSNTISLGMVYLFHETDKKRALDYFDKAIEYVRPFSSYYVSYALLYKALIKRDFGLIEEAEKCSREAIKHSPGFDEAMYQNAQYNALLERSEKAIPLLKQVIKRDIVYCLKIKREKDFEQINPEVTKMFEEIRDRENKKVKEKIENEKKDLVLLNNVVNGVEDLGYDVSRVISVNFVQDEKVEIDKMIRGNSIIDAYISGITLSLLTKRLQRKKEQLRIKCREINTKIESKIKELSIGVTGKKKKGGLISFIIHFLCGQIVALPFGWYIGVPLGICITEGLLIAICFYINVIMPQLQWKDIYAEKEEQEKLAQAMKRL